MARVGRARFCDAWLALGGQCDDEGGLPHVTLVNAGARKRMRRVVVAVAKQYVTLGAWWEPFSHDHSLADGNPYRGRSFYGGYRIVDADLQRLRAAVERAGAPR